MLYNQIKDAGFPCFTIPYVSHAMPSVTSHEYALRTVNKVQSYLDSGATRHFSGIKSDFTQLKHWSEPEVVHVANGQTTEAIGYGIIQLQTSYGKRQFNNAQYVPDFGNSRLISVQELNKSGILVEFDNCITTAITVDGETFFRAVAYEGLYTLELISTDYAKTAQNDPQNGLQNDTLPANDTSPTYDKGESEEWKILHRRLGHVSYKRIN